MNIIQKPSTHFEDRKDGKGVKFIILHYTDTQNIQETFDILDSQKLSAHYVIDIDGCIYQLVDDAKRAWHAGKSFWAGETDLNSTSIGIEIQNPGLQYGYTDFPKEQMDAVKALCQDIIARHNISPENILGHSDIAPDRKKDPGEKFPWKDFADNGIGIFPTPVSSKDGADADLNLDLSLDLDQALIHFGYDPHVTPHARLAAFQRRFVPDVFKTPDSVGTMTTDTAKAIHRLYLLMAQDLKKTPPIKPPRKG